jgi:hypothetical protein
MRYENKYLLKNLLELKSFISSFKKLNKDFYENFNERTINNLYFDNDLSSSLFQNTNGDYYKSKVRLRWYNNNFEHLKLEVKIKIGSVGKKLTYDVKFKDQFRPKHFTASNFRLLDIIIITNEISRFSNLKCVSFNSYKREYYISKKSGIRLTIDNNLKFKNLRINNILFSKPYKILEVKYPSSKEFEINNKHVVKNLLTDFSKFSKFSNSTIANNYL